MTASLTPQQNWKQVSAGSALSGSGIFGFTGAQKHKAGSATAATSAKGTIPDPSLSFNKLFDNDLSKNALSETDPSTAAAAKDSSTTPSDTSSTADATSGSDDKSALSGPLSSGLMAFLLGMMASSAQSPGQSPASGATDAATATSASDTTASVQATSSVTADSGSADATMSLQDLLDELDQFAGLSGNDLTRADAAGADETSAYDELPSGGDDATITDATSQNASPASVQATALLEMQKALTAYFSGSMTNSATTAAAATSIAI